MAKPNKLHVDFHKQMVNAVLTVHGFMDNGHHIAYIPALNLSAYGDSNQEALDRLIKEVLDDFFKNITALTPDQANAELKNLGWERHVFFKKRFMSDSYVDEDGVLRNFNLPKETKIDTSLVSV